MDSIFLKQKKINLSIIKNIFLSLLFIINFFIMSGVILADAFDLKDFAFSFGHFTVCIFIITLTFFYTIAKIYILKTPKTLRVFFLFDGWSISFFVVMTSQMKGFERSIRS